MKRSYELVWSLTHNLNILSSANTTINQELNVNNTKLDHLCKLKESLTVLLLKAEKKPLQKKFVCYNGNEKGYIANKCHKQRRMEPIST